jgi:hypothetical protein
MGRGDGLHGSEFGDPSEWDADTTAFRRAFGFVGLFVGEPAIGTGYLPVISGTSAEEPLRYRLGATSGEGNNILGWRGPNYNRMMLRPYEEYWGGKFHHHESQVAVIAKNTPVVGRN